MVYYHKRGRGRPKLEKREGPTEEQLKKRKILLRGKDGELTSAIDVLAAQNVISEFDAEALKHYHLCWTAAYGKPVKYSGNIWQSIISGSIGGYTRSEHNDDEHRKKIAISRFHQADSLLKEYGPDCRQAVRMICEGKIPHFLKSYLEMAMKCFNIQSEIDSINEKIEKLKKSKDRDRRKKIDDLVARKTVLNKKMSVYNTDKESPYNIYMRETLRRALKGLARHFNINA